MISIAQKSATFLLAIVLVSIPVTAPQAAADTGAAALSGSDSDAAVPSRVQKPQTKALTRSRRDSALRVLLSTLEKEDSLNALSQHDSAETALQNKKTSKTNPNGPLTKQIAGIMRRHPRPYIVAGVMAFILLLWLTSLRIAGKKSDKRFMTTTRLSLMDGEVRRACVHIEKYFTDPALTPGAVSAAIVTGEPFLEALFQKELGMNIAGYIAQTRIHHAKQLIKENPAAEMQSVAVKSGFTDTAAFNTLFEKLTGNFFDDFPRTQ
jgi:AraC-like DNA-binding protein